MYSREYVDELYHHGIFGQKWGKRNGPPYPLKPSKHSKAEKKAGWRKSLKKEEPREETPEEETRRVQTQIMEGAVKHPDKKYEDSRKFGSQDLNRLTQRFNNEKAFNDALRDKLKSENMLNEEMLKSMSRKQKKELYKKMAEMEFNTAYNDAVRRSIDSQINLIKSQQTLKQLNAKPPGKMQKFKKATGEVLGTIGKESVKTVGKQVATYYLGTAINNATKKDIVDLKKKGKKDNKKDNDNDND